MSAAIIKRLDTIKARLQPDVFVIVRTKSPEEEKQLIAEAKRTGERLVTIQRSYGLTNPTDH